MVLSCRSRAGRGKRARYRSGGRLADRGGVAEWLKAADCKSVDVCLRRFESYPLHHRSLIADRAQGIATKGLPADRDAPGSGGEMQMTAGVAQW